MGSHVLRTKNIHCALRIGAFPFSERIRRARIVLRVFLSRFTVRMRRVYRALFGSHALRTKNISHCVLCFGAYILSSAFTLSCFGTPKSTVYVFRRYRALMLRERRIFVVFCDSGHSRFQSEEYALSVACLSLQSFTGGMSSAELLINGATREPLSRESYESWTCIYTVSLSNDIHFTNCTTRKPLFHDPYESYDSYGSYRRG